MKEKVGNISWVDIIVFVAFAFIYFITLIISIDKLENYEEITFLPIVNIFIIIISLIGILIANKNYKNELKEKKVEKYEYYRNLDFKHITPAISGILLKKVKININTIITVLFELEKKEIINLEFKNNKNYIKLKIHDIERLDNLLIYEKNILYFIFENSNDTKEYCLEEILSLMKNDATTRYVVKKIENKIKQYINEKFYFNLNEYLLNSKLPIICKMTSFIVLPLIFGYIPLIFAFINDISSNIFILLFEYIIVILISIYYLKAKYIKKQFYEEIQKLYGLYSYLSDFTLIKEKSLKFYQLYEEYYLYAMGLGLADRFENELKQNILDKDIRLALQFYFQNKGELD